MEAYSMTDAPDDLVHEMQEIGAANRREEAAQRKRNLAEYRASGAAKPKKRGHPERALQIAVVKWLRQLGCLVSATINEQRAASDDPNERARYGNARKRIGAVGGFPDLTILTPLGQVAFAELKAPGAGTVSAAQQTHAWLHSHGFVVIVARSIEEVAAGLQAAGVAVGHRSMAMAAPVSPLRREP
jgi:hypothetical protein